MPVEYHIDPARSRIYTRCVGSITLDEVLAHFQELDRDPGCPPHLDVLLDLTEQTTIPWSRQVREVSRAIGELRDRLQFGVCAVVAPGPALYGMVRVFLAFSGDFFESSRAFRRRAKAEAWLDEQVRERAETDAGRPV